MLHRDFIRFGEAIPSYGLTKEEHLHRYIEREYHGDEDGRCFYKWVMKIWKEHRPPYNVRGVYAFLNFPRCIDSDIVPLRYYKRDMSESEFRKMTIMYNKGDIKAFNKVNSLDYACYYAWEEVKAVWAKFMPTLDADRDKGIVDYIGWHRFSINERHIFEEIALDRLFNRDMQRFVRNEEYRWNREIWYIGEVFLEM